MIQSLKFDYPAEDNEEPLKTIRVHKDCLMSRLVHLNTESVTNECFCFVRNQFIHKSNTHVSEKTKGSKACIF